MDKVTVSAVLFRPERKSVRGVFACDKELSDLDSNRLNRLSEGITSVRSLVPDIM